METFTYIWACLIIAGILVSNGEGAFVTRKTKYGRVRGIKTRLAQVFLGVPFATPPERWTAPTELSRWRGVLNTTNVKPQCFQGNNCTKENPPFSCIREESEDCLYLNIYAPKRARKNSRKPVIVFLHGGSFDSGTPSALAYNGEMLAKKGDVVVVNIAYRVGPLGFLVTGVSGDAVTGNYGLMDQRMAMQWVKDNIAKFGGNPDKITLTGNSAGAYSTAIHLTSGKADDLFQQAIIQSAPFGIPTRPLNIAIEQGFKLAFLLNCNQSTTAVNVSCLRSRSPAEIVSLTNHPLVISFTDSARRSFMPWIPHVDGDEVKAGIMDSLVNTTFSGKTVMIGTVTEEAALYIRPILETPVNSFFYSISVYTFIPRMTSDILQLYDVPDPSDHRDVLEQMASDYFFICPTRKIAKAFANLDNVYMYSFNQTYTFDALWDVLPQCEGKVCHSFEVPYVFQSARTDVYKFSPAEKDLSDTMIAHWSSFARYGNPNRGITNATEWPRYKSKGGNQDYLLEFSAPGDRLPVVQGYRSVYCDALDTIGYS